MEWFSGEEVFGRCGGSGGGGVEKKMGIFVRNICNGWLHNLHRGGMMGVRVIREVIMVGKEGRC